MNIFIRCYVTVSHLGLSAAARHIASTCMPRDYISGFQINYYYRGVLFLRFSDCFWLNDGVASSRVRSVMEQIVKPSVVRRSTSVVYPEPRQSVDVLDLGIISFVSESESGTTCLDDVSSTDQLLGPATFKVRLELVRILFLFLGTLVALCSRKRRNGLISVLLDVLSSFYLLYSSYNRTIIIKNTEIAHWVTNVCAEGAGALIYGYMFLSVVSWIASSVLEFSSSLHLVKLTVLKSPKFSSISWSTDRVVTLMSAAVCTILSLGLTLVLWGFVQKSLGNLADDISVLVFLTIAAFLRLMRQLMEGVTLITGILTSDLKWQNPDSKLLFGRIAFSSFVLLIHSFCLTFTFASQEKTVWGNTQYAILMGLCIDVIFRLFTCSWATLNSCCVSRLADFLTKCHHGMSHNNIMYNTPISLVSVVQRSTPAFVARCIFFRGLSAKLMQVFRAVSGNFVHIFVTFANFFNFVHQCLRFIFVVVPQYVGLFIVVVLTQMAVAWQTYILHWEDEDEVDENDDPLHQVREEGNANHEHQELVYARVVPLGYQEHRVVCALCPELVERHAACLTPRNELILPFSPCLAGDELPPDPSPLSDFADPTNIGAPFSPTQLEVKCEQEQTPPPLASSVAVTGRLHSPISPT